MTDSTPFVSRLQLLYQRAQRIAVAPVMLWLLVGAGLLRGLLLWLAYPPAHVGDSAAYFLYQAFLRGQLDLPAITLVAPPGYPLFLLLTYGLFGSAWVTLGVQFVMGALLAPIYYLALKPIQPLLALTAAVIILGDVQTGVVFNFTATEPLYMFVLALCFWLFLRQTLPKNATADLRRDAALGAALVLPLLVRAVARYLIVPLALVFWLRTGTRTKPRSWLRTGALLAGFGLVFGLSSLLFRPAGQAVAARSSDYMLLGLLNSYPERVQPQHGSASARFLAIRDSCNTPRTMNCLEAAEGGIDGALTLITNAVIETIQADLPGFALEVIRGLDDFLSLTGQQLGIDPELPSTLQCADPDAVLAAINGRVLSTHTSWGWVLEDFSDAAIAELHTVLRPMVWSLCPPFPHSDTARAVVDFLAFRYRSLGRPNALMWYAALLVLTTLVAPLRRRYLTLVLLGLSYLLNHALLSALIDNIQPRYVVVINPQRAILLTVLVFALVEALLLVWRWAGQRLKSSNR